MSEVNKPATPVSLPTSPLSKLLGAFRYADFRVLWVSTLSNQMGQGMQQVLLGWLVLDITGSAGMVGVMFAVRSAPNLVVGFAAGSISDRLDRSLVLRASIISMMLLAAGCAAALYAGVITVWALMLAAFLMGICHTFYMTARLVYVYDIVGGGAAMQGIAVISLAQRLGGVFGALLAGGALHLWGPATSFTVMAAGYAVGGLALFWLREAGQAAPEQREPILENIRNYFDALRTNREMMVLILTTAAADLLGFSHHALLPVLAKDVLHVGPSGLGVLTAFRFFGGTLGVLVTAALGEVRRRGLLLLAILVMFGVGEILLSGAGSMWSALVFITFINLLASVTDILHQSLLQQNVPNEQRGRAMGSWLVGTGVGPLGHLQMGFLAGATGSRFALLANGAAMLVFSVFMFVASPRLRRMT